MYKKIIVTLNLALLTACVNHNAPANEVTINGNIKGLKKGKIYIQKIKDTSLVALDSIELNGTSTFKSTLKLDSPEMLYLFLDRGQTNAKDNSLPFFAEPGQVTINTDLEYFLGNAKITGSKNHELYEEYKNIMTQFNNEQLKLVEEQILGAKGNKNYNAQTNKNKQEQLLKRKYLYAANFAATHSDHEIAPYIAVTDIYDMQPRFLDTIHKKMTTKVANSLYGKQFTKFLKNTTK